MISVSVKFRPRVFARITPMVLFPAPGIPIRTMFFMGYPPEFISDFD
jgi:hypothetical protein